MIVVNWTEAISLRFGFNHISWKDFRFMAFGIDVWILCSTEVANDFVETFNVGTRIRHSDTHTEDAT